LVLDKAQANCYCKSFAKMGPQAMIILSDALSPDDVATLVAGLGDCRFGDGRKSAGEAARAVKSNQQSDGSDPKVAALAAFVRRALERHPVFASYVRPVRWSGLMFNRYGPGQAYGRHVDDAIMGPDEARIRTDLSFTLFLSDPETYEGGTLVVEGLDGDRQARLAAGSLVLYPTGALHEVEPVTSGLRLACVGWVQSLIRRPDQREILFDLARARAEMPAGEPRLLLDKSVSALLRMWGEV
jgi:PKHD-type hydroxylase